MTILRFLQVLYRRELDLQECPAVSLQNYYSAHSNSHSVTGSSHEPVWKHGRLIDIFLSSQFTLVSDNLHLK